MSGAAVVAILGNLGRPAELKYTNSGVALLDFSVAVNTKRGQHENVSWYRCTLWGKRAESLKQYLDKGTKVMVNGSLTLREYDARDGSKKLSAEIRADEVVLLGSSSAVDGPPTARREDAPTPSEDIPF